MKRVIVVGGGISGLATAYLLLQKANGTGTPLEVLLLEKEDSFGGKMKSFREEGFLCEWGPNGFLDNKPQTLDLCAALGATPQLLRSNDNARRRFIFSEGILHQLPENGPSFLKSRLLSWPGKVRLGMEPFAPGRTEEDETLAAFARRRLGEEALQKLIAPMVSGIFAGDPETMSLDSCFPRISELEREYGGLIKAMVRLARKKRKEIAAGKAVASAAGPGGILTSFRNGIQTLADIVAQTLGAQVAIASTEVLSVRKGDSDPFVVETREGEVPADAVVLATPAYATAGIVAESFPEMAALLQGIPYSSMTVVCSGFERKSLGHDLQGFGYLVPKQEGLSTLGTLWDSSIFENRAPQGMVLLRSMMGGACFPGYISLSDQEVLDRVAADLLRTMDINAAPVFTRIYRHEKAIPQYVVGHGRRVAALEEQCRQVPGLVLSGNSYRGIGLNDCVAAASRAAEEVLRVFLR